MFDRETGNSEFKVGELDEFMKSQVFILWSYYFTEHRLDCTQTRAQRIVDFEEESGGAVPGPVVRGRDGSAAEAGRQVHHQELQQSGCRPGREQESVLPSDKDDGDHCETFGRGQADVLRN